MSLKCHVVKDLLPNYIEKLTNEETNQDIRIHLEQCSQCRKEYDELNIQVPEIQPETQKANKQEVNYLKKCSKILKRALIAIGILAAAIMIIIGIGVCYVVSGWVESDKVTDVARYNEYFGGNGQHLQKYLIRNDIFPDQIPKSAKVEKFHYEYYNPWDPNYTACLVYTCSEADYNAEVERLSKLNSTKDYLIYSSTGFNYPVCAVYADRYFGYIYALADRENNRLIYVEITFCNNFCDIHYESIIDQAYLPAGFDAKEGNATRKAFEAGKIRLND